MILITHEIKKILSRLYMIHPIETLCNIAASICYTFCKQESKYCGFQPGTLLAYVSD